MHLYTKDRMKINPQLQNLPNFFQTNTNCGIVQKIYKAESKIPECLL